MSKWTYNYESGEYEEIHFLDDNSTADNVIGKCEDFVKYKDCLIYPAFGNNLSSKLIPD